MAKYTASDWKNIISHVEDLIADDDFVHEHEMQYARARTGRDPLEDYESDPDFIDNQFEFQRILKVKLLNELNTALNWDDGLGTLPESPK
jgi:hypothetical protein